MVFLIHLIGLHSLKNLKDGCIIPIKFVLGLAMFIVFLNSKQAEKPAFLLLFVFYAIIYLTFYFGE